MQTSERRETGRDLFIMERLIRLAKEFKLYPESPGEPLEGKVVYHLANEIV